MTVGTLADEAAALQRLWQARGVLPRHARWTALPGGRTNAVWRVEADAATLVCRLYRAGTETPLFANSARAERLALAALEGTGLAPAFVAQATLPRGEALLVTHVPGRTWRAGRDDVAAVATALAHLHARPLPPDLPPGRSESLLAQADRMLPAADAALSRLRPPEPAITLARPVFLHGDPVPGNLLVTPTGIRFIDWQCPAWGDACDDLALFLSPAMQIVNGNRPLTAEEQARFLSAYGDAETARRYRALAPAYHWRMVAYCRWKAARGAPEYARAEAAEQAALSAC